MLQRNVTVEVRVKRRTEYKSWNRKVKELVKESKRGYMMNLVES